MGKGEEPQQVVYMNQVAHHRNAASGPHVCQQANYDSSSVKQTIEAQAAGGL